MNGKRTSVIGSAWLAIAAISAVFGRSEDEMLDDESEGRVDDLNELADEIAAEAAEFRRAANQRTSEAPDRFSPPR